MSSTCKTDFKSFFFLKSSWLLKNTSLPPVWMRVWSFSLLSPFALKCSVFKLYKWITSSCCYSTVVLPVFGHVDISFVTPLLTPAVIRNKRFIFIFQKTSLLFHTMKCLNWELPSIFTGNCKQMHIPEGQKKTKTGSAAVHRGLCLARGQFWTTDARVQTMLPANFKGGPKTGGSMRVVSH